MIIFKFLTLCTALKWSKTGIPLNKAERKAAKAERDLEKLGKSIENDSEESSVKYTPQQILIAQEAGVDTSNWETDADFTSRITERAGMKFVSIWTNLVNFTGDHLRIPYRFKTGDYKEVDIEVYTV